MPDGMTAPPFNTISPNDFLSHLVELQAATREKDKGVAKVRNIRKQMEAKGTDLRALDLFLSLRKEEPEVAKAMLRTTLRYCRFAEMKIGDQGSLFVDGVDLPSEKVLGELAEAEAYNDGYNAGKAGRSSTGSGLPPGSPLHQRWRQGWDDGQAELAEIFCLPASENGEPLKPPKKEKAPKAGAAVAAGAPRGRGRPRKANGMDHAATH